MNHVFLKKFSREKALLKNPFSLRIFFVMSGYSTSLAARSKKMGLQGMSFRFIFGGNSVKFTYFRFVYLQGMSLVTRS